MRCVWSPQSRALVVGAGPAAARHGGGLGTAFGLAMGPAAGLGLARFGYTLLLPSMRAELNWSFAVAGALNAANSVGYLLGALLAGPLAHGLGTRRAFVLSAGLTALSLLATAATNGALALAALRAAGGVFGAWVARWTAHELAHHLFDVNRLLGSKVTAEVLVDFLTLSQPRRDLSAAIGPLRDATRARPADVSGH